MKEKLTETVLLRVSKSMHDQLLKEAGGNEKLIPAVVRDKIESSYFGKDDVRAIRARLDLTTLLLKELLMDNAPLLARMNIALGARDAAGQNAERKEIETIKRSQLDKFEKLCRDAGII